MSKFEHITVKLASLEGSTKHISLSFAMGVLIGFSSFMGLHTIIALSLCFLTKLNKPALMIGCFFNIPWNKINGGTGYLNTKFLELTDKIRIIYI